MAEQVRETATGQKINWVFTNLQNLQIQPTEHNVQILAAAQKFLKEAYGENQAQAIENGKMREQIDVLETRLQQVEGFMREGEAHEIGEDGGNSSENPNSSGREAPGNVVRMPEGTGEKERQESQESQDALDGNPPCCGEEDI